MNVGRRRVAMARLVAVLEGLGSRDVWTYVNSGNAVFRAPGTRAALERTIERALEAEFGFAIETFVRSPSELGRLLDDTPFPVRNGDTHFVTFLSRRPDARQARALEALSNDFDTLVVRRGDVHWRMRGKSTDSQLRSTDWAAIVGPDASTSRNVTMLRRLAAAVDRAR